MFQLLPPAVHKTVTANRKPVHIFTVLLHKSLCISACIALCHVPAYITMAYAHAGMQSPHEQHQSHPATWRMFELGYGQSNFTVARELVTQAVTKARQPCRVNQQPEMSIPG